MNKGMPFGFVSAPISFTFKGIKVCYLGLFSLQYILHLLLTFYRFAILVGVFSYYFNFYSHRNNKTEIKVTNHTYQRLCTRTVPGLKFGI